jgi:hypothetical protein
MIMLIIAASMVALATVIPYVHTLVIGRPTSVELTLTLLKFEVQYLGTYERRHIRFARVSLSRLSGFGLAVSGSYHPWTREDVERVAIEKAVRAQLAAAFEQAFADEATPQSFTI